MKKILFAAAVAGLSATPSLAADLAARTYTKAPGMVSPAYNWSGWYAGVNVGWAGGGDGVSNNGVVSPASTATPIDRFDHGGWCNRFDRGTEQLHRRRAIWIQLSNFAVVCRWLRGGYPGAVPVAQKLVVIRICGRDPSWRLRDDDNKYLGSYLSRNVSRASGRDRQSELTFVCNRWFGLRRGKIRHGNRSIRDQHRHSGLRGDFGIGSIFRHARGIRCRCGW